MRLLTAGSLVRVQQGTFYKKRNMGKIFERWKKQGGKKVVLKVADEKELIKYMSMLENENIKVALIKDAGHTVVEPGTITCLGAGPDLEDKINKITGKLKMV